MARSTPIQHDVIINFRVNAQGNLPGQGNAPDVNRDEINNLSAETIRRAHRQAELNNRQTEIRTVTSQGHNLRYVGHTREQLGALFSDTQARILNNPALAANQAQFAPIMQNIQNLLQQAPQPLGRRNRNGTYSVPGVRGFVSAANATAFGAADIAQQIQGQLSQLMEVVGGAESAQSPLMAGAKQLKRTINSGGFVNKAHRLLTKHESQARVLGLANSPEHAALQNALHDVVMAEPGSPAHIGAMAAANQAFDNLRGVTTTRGSAPGDAIPHALRVAGEMTHRGALGYDRVTELNRRLNDPTTSHGERVRAQAELNRLGDAGGPEGFRRHAALGADHAARAQAHAAHWTPEQRAADPQGAMEADKALEAETNRLERENAIVRREINKTETDIQREERARARQADIEDQVSRGQRLSNAILGRSIAGRAGGFLSGVASANGEDYEPNLAAGVMKTATGTAADITMGRYIAGTGGPLGMGVAFAVDAIASGIKSSVDRGTKLQSDATRSRGTRLMTMGQLFASGGLPGGDYAPTPDDISMDEHIREAREYEQKYGISANQGDAFSFDTYGPSDPTSLESYVESTRSRVQSTRNAAFARFSQGGRISASQMEEMMSLLSSSGVNIGSLADSYDAGSPIARELLPSMFVGQAGRLMSGYGLGAHAAGSMLLPSMFVGQAGRLMSGYGLGAHAAGISINTGLAPQTIAAMMAAGAGGRGGALSVDAQGNYWSAAAALGGLVQTGMVTMPGANQFGASLAEMVGQGYTGDLGKGVSFYGNLGIAGLDVRHTANFTQNLLAAHQASGDILGEGQFKAFGNQLIAAKAISGGGTLSEIMDRRRKMSVSEMNAAQGGGELGQLIRQSMGLTAADASLAEGVGDASSPLEIFSMINAAMAFTTAGKNEEQLRKEGYGMSAMDESRARRIEETLDEVAVDLASIARSLGSIAGTQ